MVVGRKGYSMNGVIVGLISLICTILGALLGYLTFKNNQKKEIKEETKEDTKSKVELNTKLDVVLMNNTEIKGSVKELDRKLDAFKDDVNTRLTRVEESSKQAHKRIDTLESKIS